MKLKLSSTRMLRKKQDGTSAVYKSGRGGNKQQGSDFTREGDKHETDAEVLHLIQAGGCRRSKAAQKA